jgi:hypothetical protein
METNNKKSNTLSKDDKITNRMVLSNHYLEKKTHVRLNWQHPTQRSPTQLRTRIRLQPKSNYQQSGPFNRRQQNCVLTGQANNSIRHADWEPESDWPDWPGVRNHIFPVLQEFNAGRQHPVLSARNEQNIPINYRQKLFKKPNPKIRVGPFVKRIKSDSVAIDLLEQIFSGPVRAAKHFSPLVHRCPN